MAKSSFPMPGKSGGGFKKLVALLVFVALVVLVVKDPLGVAAMTRGAAHNVGAVVDGFTTFVHAVFA